MLCKNMQSERSQGIRAGDKIYNIHKRRRDSGHSLRKTPGLAYIFLVA